MRRRLGQGRWLLALALIAWLLAPAVSGRAEEAGAAAAQARGRAAGSERRRRGRRRRRPERGRRGKLDNEDEKAREKKAQEQKKWRAKTKEEAAEAELAQARQLGRRTGRFLVKARELLMEQKYDESNEVLARLNLKRLNSYERASIYRLQGYNAYGKEQIAAAVELLHKAINEKVGDTESRSSRSRTSATSCSRSPRCRCRRTTSRARSRR